MNINSNYSRYYSETVYKANNNVHDLSGLNISESKALSAKICSLEANISSVSDSAPTEIHIEKIPKMRTYTGHAKIDNAITKAFEGQSQEVRDTVNDIIRNDFLVHDVYGLTEKSRHALISLGMEKAKYIADNNMDEETASMFMEAMSSVAKIASQGVRSSDNYMNYNIRDTIAVDADGYIKESVSEKAVFIMEQADTKAYEEYQKIAEQENNDDVKSTKFLLKWCLNNIKILHSEQWQNAYNDHLNEQYQQMQKTEIDNTFEGVNTSSKENFIASILEKLQENDALQNDFFMDRINSMKNVQGNALFAMNGCLDARV